MFRLTTSVPALAAAVLASTALADVASIVASKDNTLYQDPTGFLSNGAGEYVFVGKTSGSLIRRAVLSFDVAAAIPAGSTINSVTLRINADMTSGSQTLTLHRLLADWGEGGSNAGTPGGSGTVAQAGDATWIHTFSPTGFWTTPGGDFVGANSASLAAGSSLGAKTFASTNQFVADVQSFLNNPAGNFGWIIVGSEGGISNAHRYASSENQNANLRPTLTVDYTIPAPASIAVTALGAIALVRRRR